MNVRPGRGNRGKGRKQRKNKKTEEKEEAQRKKLEEKKVEPLAMSDFEEWLKVLGGLTGNAIVVGGCRTHEQQEQCLRHRALTAEERNWMHACSTG